MSSCDLVMESSSLFIMLVWRWICDKITHYGKATLKKDARFITSYSSGNSHLLSPCNPFSKTGLTCNWIMHTPVGLLTAVIQCKHTYSVERVYIFWALVATLLLMLWGLKCHLPTFFRHVSNYPWKRGKKKTGQEKREKDNIPIYFCTNNVIK